MKYWLFVFSCIVVWGLADTSNVWAQADLEVTASIAPTGGSTDVLPDQLFGASVTITNNGFFLSDPYEIHFYYCPNANTTGCVYLDKIAVTDPISSGQSRIYNTNLTFPLSALPGQRYLRIFVDGATTVTESNENNNNRYDPVTVRAFSGPDLDITASAAPVGGGTVAGGSSISVSYTVLNKGAAFTQDFVTSFAFCTSASAGTCTTPFSTQNVTADFAQGQTRTLTHTLTTPSPPTTGTYYIRIFVDANFQVTEYFELNNDEFAPISIKVLTQPDVTITSATSIGTIYVAPGQGAQIQYTIENIGVAFNTNFSVRFDYCTTNNPTSCTTPMLTQSITDDFTKGQKRTYTQALTIPASAVVGTRYIRVVADALNNLNEDNENNNNFTETIFVSQPDLLISASTAPVGATYAAPGQVITLNYTLDNGGTSGAVTTPFQVHFFYCPNANATGCTQLTTATISDDFPSGQSRSYSASLTIPASITTSRTSYIRTFVDATSLLAESNETNNNDYEAINIRVPDLTVSASTVPVGTPTINPGSTFNVSFTILNDANGADVTAAFTVEFFSCPGAAATGCTSLTTRNITDNFTPGQSRAYTQALTIPAATPTGTRTLRFLVDAGTSVVESDETNNDRFDTFTVTALAQPDLLITTLTAAPTQTNPGSNILLGYAMQNAGNAAANNVKIRFYYSTDATITTADTYLQVERTYTFGPNTTLPASSAYQVNITLPAGATIGTGYLGAIIDFDGQITESDETNNTKSVAITIAAKPEPIPEPTPEPRVEPTPEPKAEPLSEPLVEPKMEPIVDAGTPDAKEPPPPDTNPGNCYDNGCPTGQICQSGACISDPCIGVTCQANQFCRAPAGGGQGVCVDICGCLTCPANQRCEDGTCTNDTCAGTTCPSGEFCDATNGNCIKDQCQNPTVTCGKGRTCRPSDGICVDAPCWNVTCPQANECKDGQCVGTQCQGEMTPEATNEPANEPGPQDTADSGSQEDLPDTASQDTVKDTGAADVSTDNNTPEPIIQEQNNTETPATIERSSGGEGSTPDTAPDTIGTTPPPGGCCQMGKDQPIPLILLLLVAFFLLRRPTSRNTNPQ